RGLDELEVVAVEVRLEVERIVPRQRAALPVEPLVDAEIGHVPEREPRLVDHSREEQVMRLRAERDDDRELFAALRGAGRLVEHLLREMAVELGLGRADRQRHGRALHELLGRDRQPLREAVWVDGGAGVTYFGYPSKVRQMLKS